MRSHRTIGATVLTVAALLAAGCGGESSDKPADNSPTSETDTTAPADPNRYVVWVDNVEPAGFPATYEYFFPDDLTVHPGASIDFKMEWSSGEPHNVAVGTTVQGAREAIDALPADGGTIAPGMPLPVAPELQAKFAKMPQALPPDRSTTADTMRLAQPCYVETGDPPLDRPCSADHRSSTKPFDGSQSYISSQVMIADDDNFDLQLSPDIPPGGYTYICTLHPSYMYGTINVVPEATSADTPGDVTERGRRAIDALNDTYRPVAERIVEQTSTDVVAGGLGNGPGGTGKNAAITINSFPAEIDAAVDQPLTWDVVGAHMFSFNPPDDRATFTVMEERDGVVQPVEWQPDQPSPGRTGMPAFTELIAAMTSGRSIEIDGGTVSPDEYVHSGLLFGSLGPLPKTLYTLRFTAPGRYTYYCTRHPGMSGNVEVSG